MDLLILKTTSKLLFRSPILMYSHSQFFVISFIFLFCFLFFRYCEFRKIMETLCTHWY